MYRLIVALFLLSTAPAMAQRIALGMKAGLLGSRSHAHHIQTSPVAGATGGLYLPYAIGERMELQPELLAAYLGSGYQEPDGDRYSVRTLYVQVPLSVKVFLGSSINIQGGPQMGWLMMAQLETPEGTSVVTDKYHSMDWGMNIGAGADLRSGWDLTLRYYSGMEPTLVGDQALFPRNRSVQFTAGYRIMDFRTIKAVRRRR